MTIEDFWLRLYGLSADLHPVSDAKWHDTMECLLAEFGKFPNPTRDALRAHVALMITRLSQLHARLA
jgi:hypothetical protein